MTLTYAAVPTLSIALALDGVVKLGSLLVAKQQLNSTTPTSIPSDLELKISQTSQMLMAQPLV
ncbi:hypothetical protein FBU59_000894 [Linderina macrospora]|uniref:Uncharacterized protein n=1 Tax=Linderina macrospora TaxID=4868 RepID=A0ACC1JFT2_9FUNG|nr:hypothetical protein FBU59_000894 [Linderina macrospora]